MPQWTILSVNNEPICTVKSVERHGQLMSGRWLTVDIDSPVSLPLSAGCYIDFGDVRYSIRSQADVEKSARPQSHGGAFTYKDLRLDDVSWQELEDTQMCDYVYGDNRLHYSGLGTFSFYVTKASDLGYRVLANLRNKYGNTWDVKIDGSSIAPADYIDYNTFDEAKSISISSGTNVKECLDLLWSNWGVYYTVENHVVDIITSSNGVSIPLRYGKNNGLKSIRRKINPNVEICTRVRAYGSERNMPYKWYNNKYNSVFGDAMYVPQLMLPHYAYVQDGEFIDANGDLYTSGGTVDLWSNPSDIVLPSKDEILQKYGKRDKEVHWNSDEMGEIFPSMKGMTATEVGVDSDTWADDRLDLLLSTAVNEDGSIISGTGETSELTTGKINFKVQVPNPGFDPMAQKGQEDVVLLMQSGMCQSRGFVILKSEAVIENEQVVAYDLTCVKSVDDEIDQVFPNGNYTINGGEEYVYTGLSFSGNDLSNSWLAVYIGAAEKRLLRAAALWLREHQTEQYVYEITPDNVYLQRKKDEAEESNEEFDITEGDSISLSQDDFGNSDEVVETVTVVYGKEAIPTYEITFLKRDESESLGDRVKGLVGQTISVDSDIAKMNDSLYKKVNKSGFHTLFDPLDAQYNVLDINGDLSNLKYIRANVDFYSVKGVSALGTGGPGGGGGGDLNEPLASINTASLGTPTASGQVITWNGSQWIYAIPQGGGGGGTGTVTSITAGTGLSGGTITTTGTIAISSTYQTYISNGNTAYGWGNHANAGYLTSSDIADMATKTWVNQQGFLTSSAVSDMATKTWVGQQGFVTANNYLIGVSGSANGVMTFAREGLSSLDFDSRHTHSNYVSSIYYNNSATLTSPYYVVTSGSINGNTMTLGRSKLSDLLNAAGYTWWGQTMSASGVVSGDISMNIGDRIYFDNKNTLEVDAYSVALGYGYRTTKPIGLYGSAINFYPNGSNVASVTSDGVIVGTSDSDENHYIQIGGCRLCWDDDNNSLYVIGADDEPCNFYSLGGVSALGAGVDGGGGVSLNALLNSINSSSIGSTAPSASNVGKCLVWTANGWAWGTTGSSSGGTVTSVGLSMPTGFTVSGSPITSSGTLTVDIATGYFLPTTTQRTTWNGKQDAISDLSTIRTNASHGETAYNSLSNYLTLTGGTLTGALHMGSATGESPYIYWGDGTYVYIGEDSDDHMSIRGARGVNILTGSGYNLEWNGNALATQDWVEGQGLATHDWVVDQGYVTSSGVTSVATGTGLTGGTITTSGTISINSTYQTYISHGESAYNQLYGAKWWGQSMDSNNMVSGDISMNVGERINFDNNNTLEVDNYSVALGYGWRSTKPMGLYGTAINFYPSGSQVASVDSSGLRVNGGYYLDGKLFANNNNGLHIGYGFADAELPTTIWGKNISFRSIEGNYGGCVNISNTYGIMGTDFIGVTNKFRFEYDSTNNTVWVLKANGTAVNFASLGGISALGAGGGGSSASIDSLDVTDLSVGNTLNLNGNSIYMDGGDITDAYTIYAKQLCVGGSGASTIKKIYWNGTYLQVQIGSSTYNFRPV